ncbi:MAG: hypothetical protein PHI32_13645 [Dysgonamonadaceae bacterium]|nr:hypothetical protein [Dysgonamonadaceae bacterium]
MNIKFLNFYTFENLWLNGFRSIPNEKGIYIVMVPEQFDVQFLENTTAITTHNGKNLLYPACDLRTKYNSSDRKILYVGKAGGENNKLRQRIRQYVKYGYGEANNHRGGRAIWQIKNSEQLLIGYHICEKPRDEESILLAEYYSKYGTFPVANWKG